LHGGSIELTPLDKFVERRRWLVDVGGVNAGILSMDGKLQLNHIQLKIASSSGQVLLDAARSPELIPESR
jgi:hypothetical protein